MNLPLGFRGHFERAGARLKRRLRLVGWVLALTSGPLRPEPLPAQTSDDWPMLGHNAARSGATTAQIEPPFVRKWHRLFPDEGIQSGVQPVVAAGRVFLGTLAGALHAIDAETGRDVWRFQAGGPILHAAAAADGRVFFGSADGKIQAVSAADGALLWSVATGPAVWNAPAVHGGSVLIGTRDGRLLAIEAASGQARWSAAMGFPILNSPAVDAVRGRVYVGAEDMRVRACDLADGRIAWTSERLPGSSLRGYHPVIAPDGSVMITTSPVIGYDRFQGVLLEMAREVFGDFASWRHTREENAKLREQNFRQFEDPAVYDRQMDFLRRRLTEEPGLQTFFVLDPETGRQRYVTPIVASESMNGPGAPPLVTPEGRVIVKFQALLRSRYQHYSPFMNVGYLDTATGRIEPLMDESRTYGWHDSLLLVHDEQSQLAVAGRWLLNTHQDNVNALDLGTLKGEAQPFAWNVHEPAQGEALALRLEVLRGRELPAGKEWLIRGTAVYGGGSVLDVPVAVAGDSFYYLPTHELNSGCALIAYRSQPGAQTPNKPSASQSRPTDEEWSRIQALPWDWDSLGTPRLKNLLEALPGRVPGTQAAPLTAEAREAVKAIGDEALDALIWAPAFDPSGPLNVPRGGEAIADKLRATVAELIRSTWRPLVTPAGKAPEEARRYFSDPSQTLYAVLLARPFLDGDLLEEADRYAGALAANMPRAHDPNRGQSRVVYDAPERWLNIAEETVADDLARVYPLWLWSRTPAGRDFWTVHWTRLRSRIRTPAAQRIDDCGNGRLAGWIAYCRVAREMNDREMLDEALPKARHAMRERLTYELAHPRGGVIGELPRGGAAFMRWRRLTPEVAAMLSRHGGKATPRLMADYGDYHRPAWWVAWNVEQLVRNEVPFQSPSTPLELFEAKALLLEETSETLADFLDVPWCRADEYYVRKLALTLHAAARESRR